VKQLALVALVLAGAALAGSQGYNRQLQVGGPAPSAAATLGVTLAESVGCRCTVFIDAGVADDVGRDGLNPTGYVTPFFYSPQTLWVEGNSSLRCNIEAKSDGGKILGQVCPDIPVAARSGRIMCAGYGTQGKDAGTGADQLSDAGFGPAPVVRTECWGPNLIPNGQ
jgi:hypothetical protein